MIYAYALWFGLPDRRRGRFASCSDNSSGYLPKSEIFRERLNAFPFFYVPTDPMTIRASFYQADYRGLIAYGLRDDLPQLNHETDYIMRYLCMNRGGNGPLSESYHFRTFSVQAFTLHSRALFPRSKGAQDS